MHEHPQQVGGTTAWVVMTASCIGMHSGRPDRNLCSLFGVVSSITLCRTANCSMHICKHQQACNAVSSHV